MSMRVAAARHRKSRAATLSCSHRLIFRWRWAEDHFQAQTGSNSWRYVDPADATAAWPMRKAQLEREITVEPVTASMLRDLLDEAYEDGRADEHAGCERGERRD